MKAVFEFNLPEDREEYLAHVNAQEIANVAQDADNVLRSYEKYSEGTIEEAERAIGAARELLNGIIIWPIV